MRWGNALQGWALSKKVGRVSGGCRSTLQAWRARSIFIQSPTPRLFFSFSFFVLAGKVGNYIVNATPNRKRNTVFLKKKRKEKKSKLSFCVAFRLRQFVRSAGPDVRLRACGRHLSCAGWCLHAETNFMEVSGKGCPWSQRLL